MQLGKHSTTYRKNLLPPLYNLKIESIYSPKWSVHFYRTSQRKIPEDNIVHKTSFTYQAELLLQYVTVYFSSKYVYSDK